MPFVLDNSVVSGWFIQNQATAYTEAIAVRLQEERAVVPTLWELEFGNVLRSACLRRAMTAQAAQAVVAQIMSLPIDVNRHPVPPGELLALSLRFGLTTYDAAYLELALRLQLPIATIDAALHDAALASGCGVVAEGG